MIRNVVFDVGNVFVRWSPAEVVELALHLPQGGAENQSRAVELFQSPIWSGINRGELTRMEAERAYCAQHGLSKSESKALFFHAMDHQLPIEGTEVLARRLKRAGFRIFGLTDNIHDIVEHLKGKYTFWEVFEGAIVSADIGVLKPHPAIFRSLLDTFDLSASETVFIDDTQSNVEGARIVGIHAVAFTTSEACERELNALGLSF